jgi:hypothetical protein
MQCQLFWIAEAIRYTHKAAVDIAWQDNNIVTALSTIHTVHQDCDWIERDRKRPAKTSTNAGIARKPFGDKSVKKPSIPLLIDDYNHHMGGVDIANQLRANYETHQKAWRSGGHSSIGVLTQLWLMRIILQNI